MLPSEKMYRSSKEFVYYACFFFLFFFYFFDEIHGECKMEYTKYMNIYFVSGIIWYASKRLGSNNINLSDSRCVEMRAQRNILHAYITAGGKKIEFHF